MKQTYRKENSPHRVGVPKDKEGKLMRKQNLTMVTMFGALLAVLPASAATIATNTVVDGWFGFEFVGQSFTTPAGGPWNHITFNFFGSGTAVAEGTLYIFTSAFTGGPADLSRSTPLAMSTGVSNGAYMFDPAFTLPPNTTYYAYSDWPWPTVSFSSHGGGMFIAGDQVPSFQAYPGASADFLVSGEVVADLFVRALGDISTQLALGGID